MFVEIETDDVEVGDVLTRLASSPHATLPTQPEKVGEDAALPPGVTITSYQQVAAKNAGAPEIIQFALSFGAGVASNVLSNWLYELLRGRGTRLRIKGRPVAVDAQQIQQAIDEGAAIGQHETPSTTPPTIG